MGRLLAIIFGGAALTFYLPVLLPDALASVVDMWQQILPEPHYENAVRAGGGLFAAVALVLLAVRSKD